MMLIRMIAGKFEFMSIDADEDEHSIEMQLPYIAKVMEPARGNFTIVPVMVGSLSPSSEAKYGKIFAKYLKVLIEFSYLFCKMNHFCRIRPYVL